MNKISAFLDRFITEEEGSGTSEYGNVYLLVAIALFVIFAAFKGGMMTTVETIASEFVNKLDSLSIADSGRPNM